MGHIQPSFLWVPAGKWSGRKANRLSTVNILQTIGCSSYCVHTRACKSYIDDLTTVPYIADDNMAQRLYCTAAHTDDGPVRPETCRKM